MAIKVGCVSANIPVLVATLTLSCCRCEFPPVGHECTEGVREKTAACESKSVMRDEV